MSTQQTLRECLLENVDDLQTLSTKMISFVMDREKRARQTTGERESLTSLFDLFEHKQCELRENLEKVKGFRERAELIRQLERCVENRDAVITHVAQQLKEAESELMQAIHRANEKLKVMKQSESRRINSEDAIKFAHQISKNYSVAAPLFWQQGDPSRPFPTEAELRNSQLANPTRGVAPLPSSSFNLVRQGGGTVGRTPPIGGRLSSPYNPQQTWSPRNPYAGTSSSPRGGRGGPVGGWGARGGASGSPYTRRLSATSPAVNSSRTLPVSNVEQMSSDSSSSSSSEESPS